MGSAGTKRSATVTVQESGELGYQYQSVGYTLIYSYVRVAQGPSGSSPPPGLPEPGDSGSPLLCNGTGVIQGVYGGRMDWPFSGRYYTGIESTQTWDSAWATNVAANYVNEPMVSVTSWGTNRFDLFVRGTDGAIYTKTWDTASPQLGQQPLVSIDVRMELSRGIHHRNAGGRLWGNNRIDIFMRGGDPDPRTNAFNSMALHHLYWNGSSWNWQQIGTWASHRIRWLFRGREPPGRLRARLERNIYHYYSSNGTSWAFEAVPTDGGPTTFLPTMKAISTSAGTLDLYAVGTNGWAYHNHYDQYGVWSGWNDLHGLVTGTPAVTTWGGGRQDIFFKGADTNLYHKVLVGGSFLPSQSDWDFLGGPVTGSPAAASMQSDWLTLISTRSLATQRGCRTKGGSTAHNGHRPIRRGTTSMASRTALRYWSVFPVSALTCLRSGARIRRPSATIRPTGRNLTDGPARIAGRNHLLVTRWINADRLPLPIGIESVISSNVYSAWKMPRMLWGLLLVEEVAHPRVLARDAEADRRRRVEQQVAVGRQRLVDDAGQQLDLGAALRVQLRVLRECA